MSTTDLGALIRLKRKEKGMKQKDLAGALYVTVSAVNKWETGKNYPDLQNLYKISQLLDIPIAKLLGSCTKSSMQESDADHASSRPDLQPSSNEEVPSPSEEDFSLAEEESSLGENDASAPTPSPPEVPVLQTEEAPEPSDTAIPDIEDVDFIEVPGIPIPQPENTSDCPPLKGKRIRLKTAIPLLAFLLVGITAVFWMARAAMNNTPSFTVRDSYYGEYEGEYVYYIITEYGSDSITDDLFNHTEMIRTEYEDHFSDVTSVMTY